MAYSHGREDRKWRIWKEAEEKVLREHGVDEAVIEQIRMEDRADFNSNFGRKPRKAAQGILSALRTGRGNTTNWKCLNNYSLNFGRWNGETETFSNGTSGTGNLTRCGMKRFTEGCCVFLNRLMKE